MKKIWLKLLAHILSAGYGHAGRGSKPSPTFCDALLVCAAVLLLSGCSKASVPKTQVAEMLEHYQNGDIKKMLDCTIQGMDSSVPEDYKKYVESEDSKGFGVFQESELILHIAQNSKFKTKKESVEGNTATVELSISGPNMESAVSSLLESEGASRLSGSEIAGYLQKASAGARKRSVNVFVQLKKINDEWLVDLSPYALQDGLSGGLLAGYELIYREAALELESAIREGKR